VDDTIVSCAVAYSSILAGDGSSGSLVIASVIQFELALESRVFLCYIFSTLSLFSLLPLIRSHKRELLQVNA
jgi:hypothetical protein